MKYNIDDEVYWTDPDNNFSSGIYKIVEQINDDGEDTIYTISNGTSIAEVFEHELS